MSRVRQLIEVADVLVSPGGARAIIRWKPRSVTAFKMLRALREQGLRPRTIIDGGANIGQFARAAAETFPEARIVAFEPLVEVAEQMRSNLSDSPRVEIRSLALGDRDGTVAIHRHTYSPSSSVLSMRPEAAESLSHVLECEIVEVPVARLDTALDGDQLDPPVLLKLDLQGYELEALRGAVRTLERTQHVVLETSFVAMYENEPLFDGVYDFLTSARFRFLCPVSFLRDTRGRITQMDALFEAVATVD